MHVAAHLDSLSRVILPSLRSGKDVVLDRYWWSTWVYGRTSGLSETTLRALLQVEWLVWGRVRPSVVLLIERSTPLRPEEPKGWKARVRAYMALARKEVAHHPVGKIDNSGSVDDAMREIIPFITQRRRR
jgi:dTMP kinase